ncbi:MAG: hypothetical protein JWM02_742 [Frankiales bacterium]|nr:hypothetical protein [Frankiales bacterium]
MCVLCYELAEESHWADVISDDSDANDLPVRARHRRKRILAAVLSPYGLEVSDPGSGRYVVIADRKGASEVAAGLPAVWQAAQRLSSRRPDVLDPVLLEVLASTPRSDR